MNENLLGADSFKKSDNEETTTQTIRSFTEITPKFTNGQQDSSHLNESPQPQTINSSASRKLALVCIVCSIFMLIEFFGGLLSDSIAIMTDAAHLLSDLTGFLISIYALHVSNRKPDASFSFGYHRAEIVGAVASVFIIWILTAVLLSESIARLFDSHHLVNGKIMLITSSIGLVFNGVMAYVLHSGGEGHHHHHHHHEGDEHEHVHSLLRKEDHHDHDHHDHSHHGQCQGGHHHHSSHKKDSSDNNIIIEEPNEDNGSLNSFGKSKNSTQKTYVEMKQIQLNEESKTNNQQKFRNIQREMNKPFEGSDIDKRKKESYILNRQIKSEFDDIDSEQLRKRKSEIITLNARKQHYIMDYGSPHVSKHLTRDHSKLHKLDAFLGLRENEEDAHCFDEEHSDSPQDLPQKTSAPGQGSSMSSSQQLANAQHNINVQAAFIHIIGDIIQSIGVIIAASLIFFFPSYQIIDPLTTILFSIIVITTTVPIIKQCIYAIMEGNTNEGDYTMIKNELINTPGVISVTCFHLYYLSLDKAILCAHVKVMQSINECDLLKKIYEEMGKYKIYHCTIEISKDDSNACTLEIA